MMASIASRLVLGSLGFVGHERRDDLGCRVPKRMQLMDFQVFIRYLQEFQPATHYEQILHFKFKVMPIKEARRNDHGESQMDVVAEDRRN